ncbi:MAG: hypothetical protein WDO73_29605 [Ignavibacteriota bacterium]
MRLWTSPRATEKILRSSSITSWKGIGLALDLKAGRMFLTDLGGSVYSANLDGSNSKVLLAAHGNLSGIAFAELPSQGRRTS